MTSRGTKVRIVRCPKCRGVLPELPDIPVYKCGGCGATLQAKNRKQGEEGISSKTLENNPAQKNDSEHDSEDKDLTRSSQREILCSTEAHEQVEPGDCDKEQSENRILDGISSSGELNCQEKEELPSEAGGNSMVDESNGRDSNFGTSSPDTSPDSQLDSGGRSSTSSAYKPSDESIPLQIDCSLNEQLEKSQKIVHHHSDHLRSRDTVETTERTDCSIILEEDMVDTKLGSKLRDVSKSTTTRSSHAYDGSVSSYDGWDDHVSDQHPHLSKRNSFEPERVAEFVSTKGRPKKEDFLVNNKISTNSEEQHQGRKFLSVSLNQKHGSINWDQDALQETTRYGMQAQERVYSHDSEDFHPIRNWMGLERDKFLSSEPLYQRGSSAGYENGGPSNYRHDEFLHSSSLHSPDKLEYVERNQMELLRKVDELRDQLNRSYEQRGKANGRFPTRGTRQEKQRPLHYNHEPHFQEGLHCYDANYPRRPPGAYRPIKSMPLQYGFSQMPFSGKASNCRHHVDYSCLYCYPEDWQCPPQFPQPDICYNEGLCRARPGHMCYSTYNSSPASPQRHMDSNFPLRGRNTQPRPHDQRHMDHEVELYHRERRQPMKQHFRPIAGGAPFIICYSCWKLLQLPVDFLLSRKRCHKLQCGACSKVLKFSLHNRNHIVPYSMNPIAPPPSELDSCSAATTRRNVASSSHANDCPQGDPVSCSEDYGLSICKSGSTEGEPAFLTPAFPGLQSNAAYEKQPSSSYAERMEERKKKSNKHKISIEASESASPSSNGVKLEKLSLQTEVVPAPAGSPLHMLMGYSSPSRMIDGSNAGTDY